MFLLIPKLNFRENIVGSGCGKDQTLSETGVFFYRKGVGSKIASMKIEERSLFKIDF